MRNLFVLLLLAFLSISASAQMKMVVEQNDGGNDMFVLANVQRITFSDSNLNVFNIASSARSFSLSRVRAIKFTSAATAIEEVRGLSNGKLSLNYADEEISATGMDMAARATLYTASGLRVMSMPAWDGAALSVSALQPGVYILKVGVTALKFVKK